MATSPELQKARENKKDALIKYGIGSKEYKDATKSEADIVNAEREARKAERTEKRDARKAEREEKREERAAEREEKKDERAMMNGKKLDSGVGVVETKAPVIDEDTDAEVIKSHRADTGEGVTDHKFSDFSTKALESSKTKEELNTAEGMGEELVNSHDKAYNAEQEKVNTEIDAIGRRIGDYNNKYHIASQQKLDEALENVKKITASLSPHRAVLFTDAIGNMFTNMANAHYRAAGKETIKNDQSLAYQKMTNLMKALGDGTVANAMKAQDRQNEYDNNQLAKDNDRIRELIGDSAYDIMMERFNKNMLDRNQMTDLIKNQRMVNELTSKMFNDDPDFANKLGLAAIAGGNPTQNKDIIEAMAHLTPEGQAMIKNAFMENTDEQTKALKLANVMVAENIEGLNLDQKKVVQDMIQQASQTDLTEAQIAATLTSKGLTAEQARLVAKNIKYYGAQAVQGIVSGYTNSLATISGEARGWVNGEE